MVTKTYVDISNIDRCIKGDIIEDYKCKKVRGRVEEKMDPLFPGRVGSRLRVLCHYLLSKV